VHAVSLGETHAAATLLAALREQQPGVRFLLTHSTATGRDAGAALLQAGDAQAWLPWDTPGAVRRFLRHHRPVAGVLMETEVWPNLLHAAQQAGLPMVLANARLSARSLAKGRRFAWLLRPAVAALSAVLAQGEDDAARLQALGARRVQVMGNLKFDIAPDSALLARGQAWRSALGRPVVLAASTREGEEAPLLRAWAARCAGAATPPLLLLVPRHPQRFDEVAQLISATGLSVARRSQWPDAAPPPDAQAAAVWLGDSLGEMPLYYACADVALLGGSFEPLGGHNLIEAAACGCPLLMGPHTFNFAQAAAGSLAAGAAERVADIDTAVARAMVLLDGPERALRVKASLGFARQHRGAARRMARAVLALSAAQQIE
jgi:3-deoxy-D-manno-octulosonic-acid transferase